MTEEELKETLTDHGFFDFDYCPLGDHSTWIISLRNVEPGNVYPAATFRSREKLAKWLGQFTPKRPKPVLHKRRRRCEKVGLGCWKL